MDNDNTDLTTEELKRLAESITPGPWNSSIHGSQVLTGDSWNTICEIRVRKDFSAAQWEDGRGSSDPTANARAIALVPDLLRELIERREADAPLTAREEEPTSGTEREAFDFAMRVYKETGVTPDLRRVYDFYKKARNEPQPSETDSPADELEYSRAQLKAHQIARQFHDQMAKRELTNIAALLALKGADQ